MRAPNFRKITMTSCSHAFCTPYCIRAASEPSALSIQDMCVCVQTKPRPHCQYKGAVIIRTKRQRRQECIREIEYSSLASLAQLVRA